MFGYLILSLNLILLFVVNSEINLPPVILHIATISDNKIILYNMLYYTTNLILYTIQNIMEALPYCWIIHNVVL